MSSVGSSDSSSNPRDEVVRRNREDYQKKEAELVKKQAKELRRLNEQHYAEMERIKNDHQSQMENLRKASTDTISARDHRYQKEIEDIRTMYRKQAQASADESQRREESLRETMRDDQSSERARSRDRLEKLTP
ncbi:MAG: hypothetical protein HC902_10965 [Calothrix sp. SM1_5_4]|nr:hypothetical protein [Calothrix sp. SM1_5_4]